MDFVIVNYKIFDLPSCNQPCWCQLGRNYD